MNSTRKGVIYILLSCLFFSIMGAIVKLLGARLGSMELAFFRNIVGIVIIGISLFIRAPILLGGKPVVLVLRGILGASALIAYFYNITQISLSTAFAMTQSAPLFIVLFSFFFLHKRLSLPMCIAVGAGFLGVLLLYPPHFEGFSFHIWLVGIYSGAGAALAYIAISELRNHYDERIIVLSLVLSGTILPAIALFYDELAGGEGWVMPAGIEWGFIVVLGVVSTLGQIFLTKAYVNADAIVVGSMSYMTIILAVFWGVILGDALPSAMGVAGMLLIALGGIATLLISKAKR